MANFTYTKVALLTIPSTGVVSQSLLVFGTSGTITNVSIALNSLTHTFPDDLDLLLVHHPLEQLEPRRAGIGVEGRRGE